MSALSQIVAILTGRKVYDEETGLWRVYDSDGNELADESGVLFRGLHGMLLYNQFEEESSGGGDFSWMRHLKKKKPVEEEEAFMFACLL